MPIEVALPAWKETYTCADLLYYINTRGLEDCLDHIEVFQIEDSDDEDVTKVKYDWIIAQAVRKAELENEQKS